MDEMTFAPSASLSIGVELELQLVRPRDLDLSRDADELLTRLKKRELPGAVKPEITESMIELNSSVHSRHAALLAELEALRDIRRRRGGRAQPAGLRAAARIRSTTGPSGASTRPSASSSSSSATATSPSSSPSSASTFTSAAGRATRRFSWCTC